MIEFYTAATSNGRRVAIMLEETGLDYTVHQINLSQGEQRQPKFLKLNPAHGIPVIVEQSSNEDPDFVLTQSVAILIYLAEKSGKLMPCNACQRARMYQWLLFDATDISQVRLESSRLGWNDFTDAAAFLYERVLHRYDTLEQHLANHLYLAGEVFTIADISAYPWAFSMDLDLQRFPHIHRWLKRIEQRPAVQRGMAIPH